MTGSDDHVAIGSDLDGYIKPALPGLEHEGRHEASSRTRWSRATAPRAREEVLLRTTCSRCCAPTGAARPVGSVPEPEAVAPVVGEEDVVRVALGAQAQEVVPARVLRAEEVDPVRGRRARRPAGTCPSAAGTGRRSRAAGSTGRGKNVVAGSAALSANQYGSTRNTPSFHSSSPELCAGLSQNGAGIALYSSHAYVPVRR